MARNPGLSPLGNNGLFLYATLSKYFSSILL
jgi:hypothetical protein